ncbi:hypothetical protein [Rhodococcus jostii]|uniref:hypothetical protein n=1 Tax=Rhodococcus jostii TaxID=132919 RepID=UPI003648425F
MTTWTLWIGAVLVVGGSAAQLSRQAVAARVVWVLAVLAFVVTAASAAFGAVRAWPFTSNHVSCPPCVYAGGRCRRRVRHPSPQRHPVATLRHSSATSAEMFCRA